MLAAHALVAPEPAPDGLDPVLNANMFYSYVPNAVKTRKRTSAHQLNILESIFVHDKKPNATKRKELSGKLNMSPREVQVWFQNRRAKEKKLLANAKPGPSTSSPAAQPESGSDAGSPEPSRPRSPNTQTSPTLPQSDGSDPTNPSPRAATMPWQPAPLPAPFSAHPPQTRLSSSPNLYELRRNSLPINSFVGSQPNRPHMPPVSFPAHMAAPQSDSVFHRRSVHTLDQHACAPVARRASVTSLDVRNCGNIGRRYQPFPTHSTVSTHRPNLGHRASVPALFYGQQQQHHHDTQISHAHAHPPMPDYNHTQDSLPSPQPSNSPFSWHNPDPFGVGVTVPPNDASRRGLLPEAGYQFGFPPGTGEVDASLGAYEFPPRDTVKEEASYKRSIGSVASLQYSDTSGSASASTGPYFSDVASDDGDGRRASCVSTSEMFNSLRVNDLRRRSDYSTSDNGTVAYPSPPSDRGRSASLPTAAPVHSQGSIERHPSFSAGAPSELTLALHHPMDMLQQQPHQPYEGMSSVQDYHTSHPSSSATSSSSDLPSFKFQDAGSYPEYSPVSNSSYHLSAHAHAHAHTQHPHPMSKGPPGYPADSMFGHHYPQMQGGSFGGYGPQEGALPEYGKQQQQQQQQYAQPHQEYVEGSGMAAPMPHYP